MRLGREEIDRGRPAEVVTWGWAVLLGLAAFLGACAVVVVTVLAAYGS
jgi:hypothetical protein